MFSNKFNMSVSVNGKFLQEKANGEVVVPLNTNYCLRFHNKHNRRALVKFTIDGENVSSGGFIIPANSHIDIQRHSDRDASFKLVSIDSSEAYAAGKAGSNEDKVKGTIVAKFYLEKEYTWPRPSTLIKRGGPWTIPEPWPSIPDPYPFITWTCNSNGEYSNEGPIGPSGPSGPPGYQKVQRGPMTSAYNYGSFTNNLQEDVCTVKGQPTGQTFGVDYIDYEDTYTEIRLYLRGSRATAVNIDNPLKDLEFEKLQLAQQIEKEKRRIELEAEINRLQDQLNELRQK